MAADLMLAFALFDPNEVAGLSGLVVLSSNSALVNVTSSRHSLYRCNQDWRRPRWFRVLSQRKKKCGHMYVHIHRRDIHAM